MLQSPALCPTKCQLVFSLLIKKRRSEFGYADIRILAVLWSIGINFCCGTDKFYKY